MRIFTRMIKVISLMSYCTLLYIIALVDCAESGSWSFVSLVSAILVALGDWSLAHPCRLHAKYLWHILLLRLAGMRWPHKGAELLYDVCSDGALWGSRRGYVRRVSSEC
jgi:hypothetical protein